LAHWPFAYSGAAFGRISSPAVSAKIRARRPFCIFGAPILQALVIFIDISQINLLDGHLDYGCSQQLVSSLPIEIEQFK